MDVSSSWISLTVSSLLIFSLYQTTVYHYFLVFSLLTLLSIIFVLSRLRLSSYLLLTFHSWTGCYEYIQYQSYLETCSLHITPKKKRFICLCSMGIRILLRFASIENCLELPPFIFFWNDGPMHLNIHKCERRSSWTITFFALKAIISWESLCVFNYLSFESKHYWYSKYCGT